MKKNRIKAMDIVLTTLSMIFFMFCIWAFIQKCLDDVIPEDEIVSNDAFYAPPPNIITNYFESETIVVEPTDVPTVQEPMVDVEVSGEMAFMKIGASALEDALSSSEVGICKWANIILNKEEMDLLRTTVYCEVGNQDIETQVMVALTILNRLNAGYAEDIRGVIYAPNAYAVTKWSNFEGRGWTEQVAEAVDIALSTNEHPPTMFYFKMGSYHTFEGAINYKKSGTEYFSIR